MQIKTFRSYATHLSDDELLLLDVMFGVAVVPPMLRRCNFEAQFALPTHSLDDTALRRTLSQFADDEVIQMLNDSFRGHQYIAITTKGGELWSSERCPIWGRYCRSRQTGSIQGKSIISVCAVTPEIRDDFLRISFPDPARIKRTTISDIGIVPWKSFGRLHVGLACVRENREMSPGQIVKWQKQNREDRIRIDQERTWWQTPRELQKFTVRPDAAT